MQQGSDSRPKVKKEETSGSFGTPGGPDWEPDDDGKGPKWKKWFNTPENEQFDPKISKYEDSPAHTRGFKDKSPPPTEGQKHLPESYRFSKSGRVNVDPENNEIIIYRKDAAGTYHGYKMEPKMLEPIEPDAYALLRHLDKIRKNGKIIP